MKKLLVTCALPYANGPIHIGHLVEYIQADIWVRYWKLRGRDVVFLCADDTHGTPIMIRAKGEGISPEELIERVWHEHVRDFAGFDVGFDHYHSTHSPENRELSTAIFETARSRGHVEVREIEQAYCPQDLMFLPDRFIRGICPKCGHEDQYGDACEVCSSTYTPRDLGDPYCAECGATPEWRTSEHLFFRLNDFEERLKAWLHGGRVQEEIVNKLREWFDAGLREWDISRDAPYFGFEIPDHPGKYFYVWLDAPVGYMASTLDWCRKHGADFDSYWRDEVASDVVHFIGKDIVYFHALFWPATLMASGFRVPSRLHVHGFLTVDGEKMSKTRGTFIKAETYLRHLDPEYLRYYYASKLTSRVEDVDLSFADFVARVDTDLVNKIANIPSRALAILHKRCGGRLRRLDGPGRELFDRAVSRRNDVADLYEAREFAQVVRVLRELAAEINTYFQDREPWKVAKDRPDDAATVCSAALNAFKALATYLQPILPRFAEKVARMLGKPVLAWADLDRPLGDRPVSPYERLVERVDPAKVEEVVEASRESLAEEAVEAPSLSLDPLVGACIRPMRAVSIEPLANARPGYFGIHLAADRLDLQVVARLGGDFDPGSTAGRTLLAVGNLPPKTVQGHESAGMILAPEGDEIQPLVLEDGSPGR